MGESCPLHLLEFDSLNDRKVHKHPVPYNLSGTSANWHRPAYSYNLSETIAIWIRSKKALNDYDLLTFYHKMSLTFFYRKLAKLPHYGLIYKFFESRSLLSDLGDRSEGMAF